LSDKENAFSILRSLASRPAPRAAASRTCRAARGDGPIMPAAHASETRRARGTQKMAFAIVLSNMKCACAASSGELAQARAAPAARPHAARQPAARHAARAGPERHRFVISAD